MEEKWKYEDLMDLPHHQSDRRPHMPMNERAAQFSPFAALTGYEAAIAEAGRLTEAFRELDENEMEKLDRTLRLLREKGEGKSEISVLHFVPDLLKEGGAYVESTGTFIKVDPNEKVLVLKEKDDEMIRIELARIADISMK